MTTAVGTAKDAKEATMREAILNLIAWATLLAGGAAVALVGWKSGTPL